MCVTLSESDRRCAQRSIGTCQMVGAPCLTHAIQSIDPRQGNTAEDGFVV